MKKSFLIYMFMISLLIGFSSSAYAWIFGAGDPLYADAVERGDSCVDWNNGPLTICTGWTVYFKAQGPGGSAAPTWDMDLYDGEEVLDEVVYYWNYGDGSGTTGIEASHTYQTPGLYYSILTVDDRALFKENCTNDLVALDSVCIIVSPINNPHIDNPSLEKDLTHRLPFCGTFTFGTAGWLVSTTGGASIIPYTGASEGWVGFRCSSAGGTATLSFTSSYFVNLSDPTTIMDELKLFIKFRLNYPSYPSIPAGTSFDVLLYGDNSTNNLPLELKSDFSGHSIIQIDNGFKEMSLCVTAIPQDFHRINNMILRYTGGTGEASELQIDQIYLSASRVAQ